MIPFLIFELKNNGKQAFWQQKKKKKRYFREALKLESLYINRGHKFYNIQPKYFREAFCT
jgi:hypothetical protein